MLILLLHFCGEPLLADRLHQLVNRDFARAITDKQQIEVFIRLDLSFPFVFDRLDTFKLYQSLFDLVRSVASQYFHPFIHIRKVERCLH
jgi:hypothetical protein